MIVRGESWWPAGTNSEHCIKAVVVQCGAMGTPKRRAVRCAVSGTVFASKVADFIISRRQSGAGMISSRMAIKVNKSAQLLKTR